MQDEVKQFGFGSQFNLPFYVLTCANLFDITLIRIKTAILCVKMLNIPHCETT